MKKNNQKGQSTIEFIFTFAFGVSVILVIFKAAMNYTTGYLVHYATFMASRSYVTFDNYRGTIAAPMSSIQGGEEHAASVFQQYRLDLFDVNPSSFRINRPGSSIQGDYVTVGGTTTFEREIDTIGKIAGQKTIRYVSESFLGKEPTRAVCAARVCYAITGSTNCSMNMDVTLFDDGC